MSIEGYSFAFTGLIPVKVNDKDPYSILLLGGINGYKDDAS